MEFKVGMRVICYNSFKGKIISIDKSNCVVKIDRSCMMLCNFVYMKPE